MDDEQWNKLTEEEKLDYIEALLEKHIEKYGEPDMTGWTKVERNRRRG